MPTGLIVSLVGHVFLIALMAFGVPAWLEERRPEKVTASAVSLVTEAELAALTKPRLPPARNASETPAQTAAARKAPDAQSRAAEAAAATVAKQAETAAAAEAKAAAVSARADAPPPPPPPPAPAPTASPVAALPPPRRAPVPDAAPSAPAPSATAARAPAARPVEAVAPPAPKPPEPEAPAPKETLAQAPQPQRPRARETPAPPRRPPEPELAEAPAKAEASTKAEAPSNDAFASMIGKAIPTKSSDDSMAAVAASLGVGVAAGSLSRADQDAIAARIGGCWRPLKGAARVEDLVVEVVLELGPTSEVLNIRIVSQPPSAAGQFGQVAVDRARQAIQQCNPMNKFGVLTLPADKYPEWREMRIRFDPRKMSG